jgi:hypothetical protein
MERKSRRIANVYAGVAAVTAFVTQGGVPGHMLDCPGHPPTGRPPTRD